MINVTWSGNDGPKEKERELLIEFNASRAPFDQNY
jgi:hypothetical protein